jgi:hypothetical protein
MSLQSMTAFSRIVAPSCFFVLRAEKERKSLLWW